MKDGIKMPYRRRRVGPKESVIREKDHQTNSSANANNCLKAIQAGVPQLSQAQLLKHPPLVKVANEVDLSTGTVRFKSCRSRDNGGMRCRSIRMSVASVAFWALLVVIIMDTSCFQTCKSYYPSACHAFQTVITRSTLNKLPSRLPSLSLSPSSPIFAMSRIKHSKHSIRRNTQHSALPPDLFPDLNLNIIDPFAQVGKNLFDNLDIAQALSANSRSMNVPEAATSMVLDSLGRDLLVFLSASVFVTPIANAIGITPILGYLIAGAILGPHALDVFSNTKADVELGDFGILFLLFSEGLEVSTSRLQKLANYLPLGIAQISLTAGVLTAAILLGAPEFLERFLPLDAGLINIHNPIEALVLALAGTLSTSAFVFPVLKEKEWEEEASGEAATSILLLQDLAVAPLLVILPFVVGQGVGEGGAGSTDYSAIGFLTAKATLGFGTVVFLGSSVLRKLFKFVAQARSSETFVALCLLVSVGMGAIAKSLGLTDTAGAFAAGVLLANTNYRAQVQADILPFKGILLGIFFMDAGSSFDLELVMAEFPTILTGAFALVGLKAFTLWSATKVPRWMEPNRLPQMDAIKIALLLSGGGEFAFVVLALAEKLGVLPDDLGGLLTAIVLITMAITPLLGEVATFLTDITNADKLEVPIIGSLIADDDNMDGDSVGDSAEEMTQVAENAIIVCGYGEIGQMVLDVLGNENGRVIKSITGQMTSHLPGIVAFDTDPLLVDNILLPSPNTSVVYGDGANTEVLRSSGVTNPSAIFISYEDHGRVLSATSRLRPAFRDCPIYARAQTRAEAQVLQAAGATLVVVEADELPRSAVALMRDAGARSILPESSQEELRLAVAAATNISPREVDDLLEWFQCMDKDGTGFVEASDLTDLVRKSNSGVLSDEEMGQMEVWLNRVVTSPLNSIEFCRIYVRAPESLKIALGDACLF